MNDVLPGEASARKALAQARVYMIKGVFGSKRNEKSAKKECGLNSWKRTQRLRIRECKER